jgi:hypothetical protein
MINAKTVARLTRVSLWKPPSGVARLHVVHDDATITIHLETERFQESLSLCPCCSIAGVHALLDHLAARLLDAEEEEGRAEIEAEARVERQLASADSAFRAGLKRATRKGG